MTPKLRQNYPKRVKKQTNTTQNDPKGYLNRAKMTQNQAKLPKMEQNLPEAKENLN